MPPKFGANDAAAAGDESRMLSSLPSPRLHGIDRMTISGSAALPPSPRLSNGRPGKRHIRLFAPLTFLWPRIIQAIVDGTPADLSVTSLAKAALFPDPAGAARSHETPRLSGPWGRTAFNRTDNILWQQQSSSREPIVGSPSNLPVNTRPTDGAYLPRAATRMPQASWTLLLTRPYCVVERFRLASAPDFV
jgi:hypothetical protein